MLGREPVLVVRHLRVVDVQLGFDSLLIAQIVGHLLENTGRRELFRPVSGDSDVSLVGPHPACFVGFGSEVFGVNTLVGVLEDRREELGQQLEPAVRFDIAGMILDVDTFDVADLFLPGRFTGSPVSQWRIFGNRGERLNDAFFSPRPRPTMSHS